MDKKKGIAKTVSDLNDKIACEDEILFMRKYLYAKVELIDSALSALNLDRDTYINYVYEGNTSNKFFNTDLRILSFQEMQHRLLSEREEIRAEFAESVERLKRIKAKIAKIIEENPTIKQYIPNIKK